MLETMIDVEFIKQSTKSVLSTTPIKNIESKVQTMTHSSSIVESDSQAITQQETMTEFFVDE